MIFSTIAPPMNAVPTIAAPWKQFSSWKGLTEHQLSTRIDRYEHRLTREKALKSQNNMNKRHLFEKHLFLNRFKNILLNNGELFAFQYAEHYRIWKESGQKGKFEFISTKEKPFESKQDFAITGTAKTTSTTKITIEATTSSSGIIEPYADPSATIPPWQQFPIWKELDSHQLLARIARYKNRLKTHHSLNYQNEKQQKIQDEKELFIRRFKNIVLQKGPLIAFHYANEYKPKHVISTGGKKQEFIAQKTLVEDNLQKVREYMKWVIPPMVEIPIVEAPWENETMWTQLGSGQRWTQRKRHERVLEEQSTLKYANETRQNIIDDQERFESRFTNILLKTSQSIAFNYAEQYNTIQNEYINSEIMGHKTNSKKKRDNDRKPHILFIMADDLGYDDIGYHSELVFTPVLDQLADDGVKLEQYYSRSVCSPSRAQFLTGRYARRLGLEHKNIAAAQDSS